MAEISVNSGVCNCNHCYHSTTSVPHSVASESILEGDIRDALRPDPANPPHYTRLSPQPIEIIRAWELDYEEGMVLKYLSRWKYKNGLEDLYKAKRSLEMLIEREESR